MVQCAYRDKKMSNIVNCQKPKDFPNNNRQIICHQSGRFQYGNNVEILAYNNVKIHVIVHVYCTKRKKIMYGENIFFLR